MPTVTVEDKPVYYARSGSGSPALLLIHGSGGDHTLWGHQVEGLKDTAAVAALDLNGHGRSPRREGNGLSAYTADVLAVLQALGEPTVVAGHSLGGAVALNVALQGPRNLAGLALIGTGARLRVLPQVLQLVRDDFERAVESILKLAFHRDEPGLIQKAAERMRRNGQAALLRDLQTCDRFDVMDRLQDVNVPALVATGAQDRLTPVKYAEFLQQNLPQATLEVIEEAGHMVMLEQPEALNRALRRFLEALRPYRSP